MELRKGLLKLADRLEGLAARLPEALRRPVLAEFRPLKELFLIRRAPRLLLVGSTSAEAARLVTLLLGTEGHGVTAWEERPGWLWYRPATAGVGESEEDGIGLLTVGADHPGLVQEALVHGRPDAVVVMSSLESLQSTLECAARCLASPDPESPLTKRCHVIVGLPSGTALTGDLVLSSQAALRHLFEKVFIHTEEVFSAGRDGLLERVAEGLPFEAQLAFVRFAGVATSQRRLARSVVRSITAVSAAIGAQPIPLADLPVLASLQAAMVAAVMDIAGRKADLKSAAEFLASLGVNLGAALALREGARVAARFVPGFGHAVSGAVAAAGTYTMGRAAIAYYIEGADLRRARGLFRFGRKKGAPALPEPREGE